MNAMDHSKIKKKVRRLEIMNLVIHYIWLLNDITQSMYWFILRACQLTKCCIISKL